MVLSSGLSHSGVIDFDRYDNLRTLDHPWEAEIVGMNVSFVRTLVRSATMFRHLSEIDLNIDGRLRLTYYRRIRI